MIRDIAWTARRRGRHLAIMVMIGPITTLAGCGGSDRAPTAPSGPAYTISGVLTADGNGPLSGVTVTADPQLPNVAGIRGSTAQTDPLGHYSLSTYGTVALSFRKQGFTAAYKNDVSPSDQTVDMLLHQAVVVGPVKGHFADEWMGDTVARTIRGSDLIAGDDVLFGGLCSRTACTVVESGGTWPLTDIELRLHWTDPTRHLALYLSRDVNLEASPYRSAAPDRYCCSADLVATVNPGRDYFGLYIAVAFEEAGGRPPGPADAQSFELTLRPIR